MENMGEITSNILTKLQQRYDEASKQLSDILDEADRAYWALSLEEQRAAELRVLEWLTSEEAAKPWSGRSYAAYGDVAEPRKKR